MHDPKTQLSQRHDDLLHLLFATHLTSDQRKEWRERLTKVVVHGDDLQMFDIDGNGLILELGYHRATLRRGDWHRSELIHPHPEAELRGFNPEAREQHLLTLVSALNKHWEWARNTVWDVTDGESTNVFQSILQADDEIELLSKKAGL